MPAEADTFDISTHDPIREQLRALIAEMNGDQCYFIWLMMQALKQPAAASDSLDAELIRQCDQLHAVQAAIDASFEIIPDDQTRAVALSPLNARWFEIRNRIFEAGAPTTPEGAQALAWVLLDQHPDGADAAVEDGNLAVWSAIHCAEYLIDHSHPPEIGFGT